MRLTDFSGTPYWMAPEVINYSDTGDTHLAMFLVSKLAKVESAPSKSEESRDKVEIDSPTESNETTD
ncbi:hypothetical protein NC652_024147 [Populus alba x Populus x berolinensis]|nr:hypothetical protein NC652_024147 [Populus alba x Populus x berolinensis]